VTHPAAGIEPFLFRRVNGTPGVKLGVLLLCVFFIAAGLIFIPYVGIQSDEALFSEPLYVRALKQFRIRAFHHDIPLMVMSYVGALKTWLYAAVFAVWKPGLWSLRVPVLLSGAVTIWLFYRLLDKAAGPRAAVAGAALLATDATYLLTTTFDWGPVALQHLLLTAGMLLVLGGYQDESRKRVGLGFFLFGLAMWDKALFAWIFSGIAIAVAFIFPREFWRMLTVRNFTVAAASFLAGALPLIVYNVRAPWATFQGNAVFSTEALGEKARAVKYTMEGSSLFGYLVNNEWAGSPQPPQAPVERASIALRNVAGERRSSLMFWAFIAALVMAPLWWGNRRPVLFALIAMCIAWPQMVLNRHTGAGAHHIVLLWPFPQMIVAIAFACAAARLSRYRTAALAAAVAVVCGSSVLVLNQHLALLIRYGAAGVWSDAIYPLSDELGAIPAQNVFLADWGELDTLLMLHQGRIPIWIGSDPLMDPQLSPADLQQIGRMLELPGAVFICHTRRYEVFPGVAERLVEGARRLGYQKRVLRTVSDSNGRAVYEILGFQKQPLNRTAPDAAR
jgi:4-amino-4-deoxy-L-arabinose transferase-like glycosyltransferase